VCCHSYTVIEEIIYTVAILRHIAGAAAAHTSVLTVNSHRAVQTIEAIVMFGWVALLPTVPAGPCNYSVELFVSKGMRLSNTLALRLLLSNVA